MFELRVISKTHYLSKLFENFIVDWLLPIISPFLDPNQFGGFKGLSIVHYLIKFLDFIESKLDKREPHSVIAASIDLSKAFNRCDHNLIIEDLFHMKCLFWLLRLVASYLTKRTLILTYNGASSSEKHLPRAGLRLFGALGHWKFGAPFHYFFCVLCGSY